jgi:hypothetical protein
MKEVRKMVKIVHHQSHHTEKHHNAQGHHTATQEAERFLERTRMKA